MKITCDHCGTLADTNKDKVCPNCGAPLGETKDYKEFKEYRKKNRDYDLREREADIHSKEMANEMIEESRKSFGVIGIFAIGFIGLAVVIMLFIIGKGVIGHFADNEIEGNTNSFLNAEGHFDLSCDSVKIADTNVFSAIEKTDEDAALYCFNIVFKNLDGKMYNLTDITITYTDSNGNEDVVAKKPITANIHDTLTNVANQKVTYTGYITYEIPNYVNDVNIVFGKTKIVVKDFRSLMDK